MKTPDELRTEARSYLIEAAALRTEADRLERESALAARIIREEELAARTPKMPDLLGGSVTITFTKYESGRIYSYAAVGWRVDRRQNRWAITATVVPDGVNHMGRYNWAGLLSFIGEANWPSIARVVSVEYLLPKGVEPAAKETMGSYGRVKATEQVEPWHGKAGQSNPFGNQDVDGSGQYGI